MAWYTITLGALLALAFGAAGTQKLIRDESSTKDMQNLGVSGGLQATIGSLELLAAVGLVVGYWIPGIAVAASSGLVLLTLGAISYHVRANDPPAAAAPAAVLGTLAAITAVLSVLAL
ncbi:DoxX family protein [Euzebya tangerina]|uniref:DoxX family protein n=1 Tax=Euzebya tangerina TaxID=591198 RepID=UPI000E3184FC|nr:DoxX family protein [Euzebya tangerina]